MSKIKLFFILALIILSLPSCIDTLKIAGTGFKNTEVFVNGEQVDYNSYTPLKEGDVVVVSGFVWNYDTNSPASGVTVNYFVPVSCKAPGFMPGSVTTNSLGAFMFTLKIPDWSDCSYCDLDYGQCIYWMYGDNKETLSCKCVCGTPTPTPGPTPTPTPTGTPVPTPDITVTILQVSGVAGASALGILTLLALRRMGKL